MAGAPEIKVGGGLSDQCSANWATAGRQACRQDSNLQPLVPQWKYPLPAHRAPPV